MDDQKVDFAIITAVEIELKEALRAFNLKDSNRIRKDSRVYWRGQLDIGKGEYYEIVVAQTSDMANVDTALITSDTIRDWNPGTLLLVGIAGSANNEVKLGDIVVGRDIYYYERGKVKNERKLPEPITYRADATLFNSIRSMPDSKIPRGKKPDGSMSRPTVHYGVIASGEKVIADKKFREEIIGEHRKVLAIEMEGYGFSAAVWQSFEKKRHLVIRAICDRADRKKKDDWQIYAAKIASTFTKNFLLDRPITPIVINKSSTLEEKISINSQIKKTVKRGNKNTGTFDFDVFISYSHDDDKVARKISEALREKNVKAWIDYEQINPGDTFVKKMEEGLAGSSSMILLVSPNSMKSGWVEEEYITGISLTKKTKEAFRLIPILIADAELPAFLSNRVWIDLRNESTFANQIGILAKTILRGESRTTKPTFISDEANYNLDYISFMAFFPEGLIEPILNNLIEIRGGRDALNWSMRNGYLQRISNSGAQLIRIFPEKVNELRSHIQNKSATAGKLIDQLLNQVFLEENPFLDVIELGFGRTILLRDLIETAIVSKSYDSVEQNKICILARENLWRVINEDFNRVALEICDSLTEFCSFTSPGDIITKAKVLARVGKAKQAVQLFDLYRDDNLFGDSGLDEIDRIDAAMSWAKALKESGAAGQSNSELILAYENMLSLLDKIIESSIGNESLLVMKADILNNRATQIAVYGNGTEWERVRDDFNQIFSLYKQMNNNRRLVGALSNYIAHTIDRLEKDIPFEELISLFKEYDGIANKMDPCEELFFYYYQKARLFKRNNQNDPSKAIEFYKMAYEVASVSGLKRRFPIAKRWELKLRRIKNDISENDFLTELIQCANVLRSQTQDAWAVNALCDILVEIAQTYNVRGEPDRAWSALVESSQYRIMQYAYSGSQIARRGIIDVLEKMDRIDVNAENKNRFIIENKVVLNAVMESPLVKMLEWKSIGQWLRERRG